MEMGIVDRQSVVTPVQLLLDTMLATNPDAILKLVLVASVETVVEGAKFSGTASALLEEFQQTGMTGFDTFVAPGRRGGFIMVRPPRCYGSNFPYWHIVADNHDGWDEPLLDKIVQFQGICFAAISDDDTMDLHELDHVDENNFPWDHWRLVAARVPGHK
jgi:hypothetical protein